MNLNGRRIFDISIPLSEKTPVYPGDRGVVIERIRGISRGDGFNLSSVEISSHSGTHLDAPLHFDPGGESIDQIDPDCFVARTRVIEISNKKEIALAELESLPLDTTHIIFKTANSEIWNRPGSSEFKRDFVFLTEEGADYLLEKGVRLLGIDYLSIEGLESACRVHQKLLGNGVLILEGLNLSRVSPGLYTLVVLPLKIAGGDGAPARAILLEMND